MTSSRTVIVLCSLILLAPSTAAQSEVENVTLKLSLDAGSVYADGQKRTGSFTEASGFEHAYIVTGQPAGIFGYSDPIKMSYIKGTPDVFSVTQEKGNFLLPFTRGGFLQVETAAPDVGNGFLNRVSPSFGFSRESNSVTTARYRFPFNVTKFEKSGDFDTIIIRNRVTGGNDTELRIRTR